MIINVTKVRKDRVNMLIDAIKKKETRFYPKLEFNMSCWLRVSDGGPECGTVACIGGTIALLKAKRRNERAEMNHEFFSEGASLAWLGIEVQEYSLVDVGNELFTPSHKPLAQITKVEAIKMLERLRDHHVVQWVK